MIWLSQFWPLYCHMDEEYIIQDNGSEESKMSFARSGQETRYSNSHFWNRARIKKDLFKFSLSGQESRILTIKNPFQEEIKIF